MISNKYSIDQIDRPEYVRRGRIGAITFVMIVLIILIWPWFNTLYPVPEAEGLMASFGNVEIAGGGAENINQQPQEENSPTNTDNTDTEESDDTEEEVETVDDDQSTVVNQTSNSNTTPNTTQSDPEPQVNQAAIFGPNSNGTGSNSGPGNQGTPDGKNDLGGTGRGDKGDGDGKIGNRKLINKCDDYKVTNAGWQQNDKVVFKICVDQSGRVISADVVRRKSTVVKTSLINIAKGCAMLYRYEPDPNSQQACGEITINFDFH